LANGLNSLVASLGQQFQVQGPVNGESKRLPLD